MQDTARQISLFSPEQLAPDQHGNAPGLAIRVSARARRLSIKVYPRGRVEVIVPKRTRPTDVERFVTDNREWISKARASFASKLGPESYALPARIELPSIGQSFRVQYLRQGTRIGVRYRQSGRPGRKPGSLLTLSGDTADHDECLAAMKRWLAGIARQEFTPRLKALSQLTGTSYDKVHIRAQRTCWGSRSSTGTISLNLCLLFLSPALLRYLMLHELCHGRHMNHSKRFWRMVGQFEPDYSALDRALTESWRDIPAWLGLY